jgi:hypothetical protein
MQHREKRATYKKHVNPKLQFSLRLLLLIFIVLLGFVIYEIIRDHASVPQVLIGLLVGVASGLLSARMFKISWNKEAQHVTNNFDLVGVVIIVLYVIFSLLRDPIADFFADNASLASASLAILAGGLYGRALGNIRSIVKILKEQKIF